MTTGHRYRQHSSGRVKIAVALLGALLALLVVASQAPAAVKDGRTIEVFHGIEFVGLGGYPADTDVRIDVLRGGDDVVIGSTTQKTDATGLLEINHVGGGQFPAGDCWGPEPNVTPDIMPGDTVRTTVLDGLGNDTGDVDSTVVRDVFIDVEATAVDTTANTITMKGHARSLPNAPLDPAADVLELRLNADGFTWDANSGRKDLRADVVAEDFNDGDGDPTTFTHVFSVSDADANNADTEGFEQAFEWSAAAAEPAHPAEITVFDGTDIEVGNCPEIAEDALTSSSHEVVNLANVGNDMTLSGISFGAAGVNVSVPGGAQHAAVLTPIDPAAPNGHQTWTAAVPASELGALPQGEFQADALFEGEGVRSTPSTLTILKDTVAPALPTATPKPGSYERSQRITLDSSEAGSTVHYTVNGSNPTENSRTFGRPIPVTASQTIKAIAVDSARNRSDVARFRYVIRARSFVSLNLSSAKLALGQREAIRGRVFPAHPNKVVKLTIKRGKRVVLQRNVRLSNRSTYFFRYKPNRAGRYFVNVRFLGDKDHGPSARTKSFRVIKRR